MLKELSACNKRYETELPASYQTLQIFIIILVTKFYTFYSILKPGLNVFENPFYTILQIENIHDKEAMLEAAHALRLEREREKSLVNQKQEQQQSLNHTEQRVQRLQKQLKDVRQAAIGATPEG